MLFLLSRGAAIAPRRGTTAVVGKIGGSSVLSSKTAVFSSMGTSGGSGASRMVSIPASEVAAVVGRNPYKPASEVFNMLWQRWSPSTFEGTTKIDELIEAYGRLNVETQELMDRAATYKASDAVDAVSTLRNATSIIQKSELIDAEDKGKVIELLKTQVSTGHGIRTEDKVVEKVAKDEGITFQQDTELYSVPVLDFADEMEGGKEFVIRGKIDRLQQDEDGELVLVEVKSRMKRLFYEVRDYEYIQVQAYFQMLPPQIRRAKLIEQYMDETNTMIIERDDDFWHEEIEPALLLFCEDLNKAMLGLQADGE